MSRVLPVSDAKFASEAPLLIAGGGACGLTAALKAADAGVDAVVLERDPVPSGSTAMSSGFVPAAGTRCQIEARLADTDGVEIFARDILAKSDGLSDEALLSLAVRTIAPTVDWLEVRHGLEWQLLDGFLYPGHSRHRMHAVPEKTGAGLMARLGSAAEAAGVPVVTSAHVVALYCDGEVIRGAEVMRPDGTTEDIACEAMILACNGYGGNRELVRRYIPALAEAPYYGHAGNTGDAVLWGEALGADVRHLSGCQGHGSLAHPHGILITWALMMEGGFQVNNLGERFSNEHKGYSEQAIPVLNQPGGVAWSVFDQRLCDFARSFPDFRDAETAGAVRSGNTVEALAEAMRVPAATLRATFEAVDAYQAGRSVDPLGRDFTTKPGLCAPFHAVRVTGALFHTQGGLVIDDEARVVRADGAALPNLFAGGGAACGVSGPDISGYLSGNGLLTALAFGALAGEFAAKQIVAGREV